MCWVNLRPVIDAEFPLLTPKLSRKDEQTGHQWDYLMMHHNGCKHLVAIENGNLLYGEPLISRPRKCIAFSD